MSHPWLVFKYVQWEALKMSGEALSLGPPIDISKVILDYWKALNPGEVFEWEEVARDIQQAYIQLVAQFGKWGRFDERDWENHIFYHSRSILFKWMWWNASVANGIISKWVPASVDAMVSNLVAVCWVLRLIVPLFVAQDVDPQLFPMETLSHL
jgi:hypothetical protein